MKVQCGEHQPPAERVNPDVAAQPMREQREEQRAEKNPQLRANQLEIDERAARDGRGKQKRDLGLGERQRGAFVRNDPRDQHDDKKHERGKRFIQQRTLRRSQRAGRRNRAVAVAAKEVAEKIKIKIKRARDGTKKIFRLLEPPEPRDEPVAGRVVLQVAERGDHLDSTGSTGGSAGSLVARKKISSRLASPDCAENFCVTSASVPSAIFRPFCKIKRRVQISSTRWSRCELKMMAAPARARFKMESFIRRMPSGSRPVSGSSK